MAFNHFFFLCVHAHTHTCALGLLPQACPHYMEVLLRLVHPACAPALLQPLHTHLLQAGQVPPSAQGVHRVRPQHCASVRQSLQQRALHSAHAWRLSWVQRAQKASLQQPHTALPAPARVALAAHGAHVVATQELQNSPGPWQALHSWQSVRWHVSHQLMPAAGPLWHVPQSGRLQPSQADPV